MTEHSMTHEAAVKLRQPFPRESIGQLPKGGQMLDFVGHAATTDRLLTVDPEWTWTPFSLEEMQALPPKLRDAGLWIHLTVCGVTRPGFGDGPNPKECIGDAIRNAAMRFGVALDLWAKESLVEFAQAASSHQRETQPAPDLDAPMHANSRRKMFALFGEVGVPEANQLAGINAITHKQYESRGDLTQADAQAVIKVLEQRKAESKVAAR